MFLYLVSLSLILTIIKSASTVAKRLAEDLQTLGDRSWALFGTHSFRRGGCQHRIELGKTAAEIATWGGWSQKETMSMFRYFYSPYDDSTSLREFDRNDKKRICI